MKLASWLASKEISDDAFAAKIDVTRQAVWRYKADRIPKPKIMARIVAATDGAVQPVDFYSSVSEGAPS